MHPLEAGMEVHRGLYLVQESYAEGELAEKVMKMMLVAMMLLY